MSNLQFSYDQAMATAQRLVKAIRDDCERVEIAGSLRRKRQMVHDIDLVVIPKYEIVETDLLGNTKQVSLLDRKLDMLRYDYIRFLKNGDKIKGGIVVDELIAIPFDLYIATPETWATLLLIRTGSAQHNIKLTMKARAMSMILRASGEGLVDATTNERIAWRSEEDIFTALDMPWIDPVAREA